MKATLMALVLALALWPSTAFADDPFTDWVMPEVAWLEAQVAALDTKVARLTSDEGRIDAFHEFFIFLGENQFERPWAAASGYKLCEEQGHRWNGWPSFQAGVDCEFWRTSLVDNIETAYDKLRHYALWMENYYALRSVLSQRNADLMRVNRAEPDRRSAERALARAKDTARTVAEWNER